jgi:predicted membrane protein
LIWVDMKTIYSFCLVAIVAGLMFWNAHALTDRFGAGICFACGCHIVWAVGRGFFKAWREDRARR